MKSLSKIFLGVALAVCFGFAGCGEAGKGGGATNPPAKKDAGGDKAGGDKAKDDASKDNASNDTGNAGKTMLVSLKLPKMT